MNLFSPERTRPDRLTTDFSASPLQPGLAVLVIGALSALSWAIVILFGMAAASVL